MENNSSQDSSNSFYFVKLYTCWFAEYNYLTYLLNKVKHLVIVDYGIAPQSLHISLSMVSIHIRRKQIGVYWFKLIYWKFSDLIQVSLVN